MGLSHLNGKPVLLDELRQILPTRAGSVIDIGANVGGMLVSMLRLGIRDRQYLGFEPQVEAAAYIRTLINANAPLRAHIAPIGLSDTSGVAMLMKNGSGDASASISTDARPSAMYSAEERIVISTGDEQLSDVERIALLKVDVEGNELKVFRGLRKTLARCRPALVFEILPYAAFRDDTYLREYFGGELSKAERMRLVDNRRSHALALEQELRSQGYSFSRAGTPIQTLDPGDGDTFDCLALPDVAASKV